MKKNAFDALFAVGIEQPLIFPILIQWGSSGLSCF